MLSYQDAYKIAESVHQGQQDKAGGPYIDFLQNVADYLKNKGESEDVQVLAILQDSITSATKKTPDDMIQMGVPADMVDLIQKMTYHKNQAWIDEYSCHLMEKGVPAEDATYDRPRKGLCTLCRNTQGQSDCSKGKERYLERAHGRQVHPPPGTPRTQDEVPPQEVQGSHPGTWCVIQYRERRTRLLTRDERNLVFFFTSHL